MQKILQGEIMENDPSDPFFFSEDPQVVNEASLAEVSENKNEREKHLGQASVMAKKEGGEHTTNNWGHTIDHNDPVHGFTEDPETMRKFYQEHPESTSIKTPEAEIPDERSETEPNQKTEIQAESISTPEQKKAEEILESEEYKQELSEQEERLKEVYEKSEEIRDRYKNPGNVRYRLLSVAATDMERISQSTEPNERVKNNNDKIEQAVKKAFGDDKLDKYAKDTLTAVQLYFSEIMIGNDADAVSIGTTETIVSSNGQIGKKPETYRNLVVLRWIKKGCNHVVAFSPKEDTGLYALVDDSVGNSWRNKFLMAGAVNGDERKELFVMNHEEHDEFYHHEKSYERIVERMIKKENEALDSNELSLNDKDKIMSFTAAEFHRLVDLPDKLKTRSASEMNEVTAQKAQENSFAEEKEA